MAWFVGQAVEQLLKFRCVALFRFRFTFQLLSAPVQCLNAAKLPQQRLRTKELHETSIMNDAGQLRQFIWALFYRSKTPRT
jgi:hypothetical protein